VNTDPDKTTVQEKEDLRILKEKILDRKLRMYDLMYHLSQCTPPELEQSGYRKGLEDALARVLDRTTADLNKLTREHLRKYPDRT